MQQAIGFRASWLDMASENQSFPDLRVDFVFEGEGEEERGLSQEL